MRGVNFDHPSTPAWQCCHGRVLLEEVQPVISEVDVLLFILFFLMHIIGWDMISCLTCVCCGGGDGGGQNLHLDSD